MPDDRKPDQRFAMIALEMTAEDDALARRDAGLVFTPDRIEYRVSRAVPTEDEFDAMDVTAGWRPQRSARPWLDKFETWEWFNTPRQRNPDTLEAVIRTMMSVGVLEDFDKFAAQKYAENCASWQDSDRNMRLGLTRERRTGRTWRGIVELLAKYYIAGEQAKVLVVGSSDRWLISEITIICRKLGVRAPSMGVYGPSPRLKKHLLVVDDETRVGASRSLWVASNVLCYVDHTYYERDQDSWSYRP